MCAKSMEIHLFGDVIHNSDEYLFTLYLKYKFSRNLRNICMDNINYQK